MANTQINVGTDSLWSGPVSKYDSPQPDQFGALKEFLSQYKARLVTVIIPDKLWSGSCRDFTGSPDSQGLSAWTRVRWVLTQICSSLPDRAHRGEKRQFHLQTKAFALCFYGHSKSNLDTPCELILTKVRRQRFCLHFKKRGDNLLACSYCGPGRCINR